MIVTENEIRICRSKVAEKINRIINAGEFSHLVTFSHLFGGQYNLEYRSVAKLLYYTENFATALDYDVATDYPLWLLIRQYKQKNVPIPADNRKHANYIYKRSRQLHRRFPKNRYFNKNSFKPVSCSQAEYLKRLIHKIMGIHGINGRQFDELKREYQDFINYGY